jgi:hypothetical protein
MRDALVSIKESLLTMQARDSNLKHVKNGLYQHKKSVDVILNKDMVLELLRVSGSTLAKWRYKKCLKYKNRGSRLVVYSYIDIMDALADNRLTARGFNPFAAYKRLLEWYKKNVESPNQ